MLCNKQKKCQPASTDILA